MGIFGNKLSDEMCEITGFDDVTAVLSDDVNVMRRNKDCADFTAALFNEYALSRGRMYPSDKSTDARISQVLETIRAEPANAFVLKTLHAQEAAWIAPSDSG